VATQLTCGEIFSYYFIANLQLHSGTGYTEIAVFIPCRFQSRFSALGTPLLLKVNRVERRFVATSVLVHGSYVCVGHSLSFLCGHCIFSVNHYHRTTSKYQQLL